MTYAAPRGPARTRRDTAPLTAAPNGRQGILSRPAARGGRGLPFPGLPPLPVTPHRIPVPSHAHPTDRAIRVLRSPR